MSFNPVSAAEPIAKLIEELSKLPGIGPKSAQRLTYYLLRAPADQVQALAEAIKAVKEKVVLCSACLNITDSDPCAICKDEERDRTKICVVEEPIDILPLERTKKYNGLYHVLHGVIAPTEGMGPEELKIKELLSRLNDGLVTEVILATNPNLEGEATAMYLQRLIAPLGIRTTRLARGLPYGGDLEYADDVTISRALEERREV
ncbi:MAG TPA: recombination protein RecR [Dehalococcoidia bacterium]|nr:recombination protein RecR [Dehalococcoidia bacterium]